MDSRIRKALDEALSLLGELMSYDNFEAYPPYVVGRIKDFIAPFDKNGIALLDAPVVSDARELAEAICKSGGDYWSGETSDSDGRWIIYPDPEEIAKAIESFAADRERKAREETARKCAEAAIGWYRAGQLIPAHMESFSIKTLRDAIMEAAHE